ncbi:MAG TPA: DUF4838 domain-containing protein [bacterium]|nr:DUF4838 domain-containing protein [bacterium]HPN43840.1 DUF4838 domain-containing protein [bacterium]
MRIQYIITSFLVLALLLTGCGSKEQPVKLIGPGAFCAIVLDLGSYADVESAAAGKDINWSDDNLQDDAICHNAMAAMELRRYMAQIFGLSEMDIPVHDDSRLPAQGSIIFIGRPLSNVNDLLNTVESKLSKRWKKVKSQSPQGFRLDTFSFEENNDFFVLSGRTSIGSLYAVYELLDRWGVRWITPEDSSIIIPIKNELELEPKSEYFESPMEVRGFIRETIENMANVNNQVPEAFCRWMVRNRLNYLWNSDLPVSLQKQYGIINNCGDFGLENSALNPYSVYPFQHREFPSAASLPADPRQTSAEFAGDVNNDNTLSFMEAHPEWYGLTKTTITAQSRPGLCVANTEFINELSAAITTNLSRGPWSNSADFLLQLPAQVTWCNCPECEKFGNNTNKFLHLLNSMQQEINNAQKSGAINRTVRVLGLTDSSTIKPPSRKLERNFDYDHIRVILTPVQRCYNHALIDPGCTEVNQVLLRSMVPWMEKSCHYKGKFYISELYNNREFHDLPLVFTTVIHKDIPFYFETGCKGLMFANARIYNPGVHSFTNYQFARQSWRPNADLDSLRIEFIRTQYAGEYKLLKDYYTTLEEAMANVSAWRFELADRINHITCDSLSEPLLPLHKFTQHFTLDENDNTLNKGVNWELTYQYVYELRYILLEALSGSVQTIAKYRLLELYEQIRYAELVVNLYDNVIRFLTLNEDEPEMKTEALIRMESMAQELNKYQIKSPALGVVNGLQACGIQKAVQKLAQENSAIITQYKNSPSGDDENFSY